MRETQVKLCLRKSLSDEGKNWAVCFESDSYSDTRDSSCVLLRSIFPFFGLHNKQSCLQHFKPSRRQAMEPRDCSIRSCLPLSAAIMLIHPTKLTIIILPVGLVAVLFFLENVYAAIAGFGGNIAYYSHVIGFLVGIPFGIIWSKNPLRNLVITLLMLAVFLLIIYFVLPLFLPKI